MFFPFQCQKCKKRFDGEFPIGKAPRTAICPDCHGNAQRVYEGLSIGVKIAGAAPTRTFGEEMKARNEKAAYRMKGRTAPVRTVAHDFGGGDVREIVQPKHKKERQVTLT